MEAILKYLGLLPAYVVDLIALISSPKIFLKIKAAKESHESWTDALRFFAFSSAFAFLLIQLQGGGLFRGSTNILFDLSKVVVFWALGVIAGAAVIKLSWRIVGGRAPFGSVILVYFYVYSVFLLLVNGTSLAQSGLLAIFFPEDHAHVMKTLAEKGLPGVFNEAFRPNLQTSLNQSKAIYVSAITAIVSGIASIAWLIWLIATWGAYRDLNNTSRQRSVIAFCLCGIMFIPVTAFLLLMLAAVPPNSVKP
jgi:hypothetical protein